MASTNINIRTDSELKAQAEQIFSELGLNMSIAINMFLRQVVRENGIPFDARLKAPAKKTNTSAAQTQVQSKKPKVAAAGAAEKTGVKATLRAAETASAAVKEPADPTEKIKDYLDELGRLTQYPSKRKKRIQALCYMADKIPAGKQFTESEFNAIIDGLHTFHDAAIIRREMYDYGLVERSANGGIYYLNEDRPSVKELFKKYCS